MTDAGADIVGEVIADGARSTRRLIDVAVIDDDLHLPGCRRIEGRLPANAANRSTIIEIGARFLGGLRDRIGAGCAGIAGCRKSARYAAGRRADRGFATLLKPVLLALSERHAQLQ